MHVHQYVFERSDGVNLPLARWKGQPLLLVNTASRCGFTQQYEQLQQLHQEYHRSGLVVLALPCNDFGACEPDSDEAIFAFVTEHYGVRFPVTRKIQIQGLNAHPLFLDLLDTYGIDAMPRWNFHKYLFDVSGDLVEHWGCRVRPTDPLLTHQIERHLNAWVL